MEIKFLKAGTGDSILIHHQNHNILVDGGNDSSYLIKEVDKIYQKKEIIDLLVITHHDDDHIKGIIDLLNYIKDNFNNYTSFIQKVIFNSPKRVLDKLPQEDTKHLSYKQANDVEILLKNFKADWETYSECSEPITFKGLKIDFLSPTMKDLKKYSLQKGAYLTGDYRCDWDSSMAKLDKDIDDSSKDNSISNRSSIVLKLEFKNKKVLLTADVTPVRLGLILEKLTKENGGSPETFDIVQLPHHGSYRSITKKIIENIKCNTFVISTNSNRHYLPNKRAILKILKFADRSDRKTINFIFNYEDALNNLDIIHKEKINYNFKLTPNNEKYGISI